MEHLIFTGSRDHPSRGYLDKLATVCLSTGTNAYTSEDHTSYFVSTASYEGLRELLPVYLDHIFQPLLKPEDMALEVFSLDPASKKARGVVYCEMKSREYTEADQMDIRLRNFAFAAASQEDRYLETYRWECGGATTRVSHLRPEEIRAYHCKFYRPELATIVLTGSFKDNEETELLRSIREFKFERPEQALEYSKIETALQETVPEASSQFPADDESIGSVGFSWLGPHSDDLRQVMALHILMRALRESTASPLFQEFVECPDPCASDIDYDVRGSKRALITLVFSGVPTGADDGSDEEDAEEEGSEGEEQEEYTGSKLIPGLIKDRMFAVFKRLLSDDTELLTLIHSALRSFTLKIQEQYQEDPHELAYGYCLPEILSGSEPGMAITSLPAILEDFTKEEIVFWKQLFITHLIENKCHEVIMEPSKDMAATIKQIEQDNIRFVQELDAYPKDGAALLDGFTGDALPTVALPKINFEGSRVITLRPGLALHMMRLPSTAFNVITLGIDVRDSVPESLWPYLVLFQELLFQCDIQIPEEQTASVLPVGLTKYQALQRLLTSMFTNHEAGIGLGNELFSCSHLDSHLIMSATCPGDRAGTTIPDALELLLLVLCHSQFTAERISVTLDTLVSQLSDCKRDPSTIIEAVFSQECRPSSEDGFSPAKRGRTLPFVSCALSIFKQEGLLQSIKAKGVTEDVIEKLNAIRTHLLQSLTCNDHCGLETFIHVGVGLNEGNNWCEETSCQQIIHKLTAHAGFKLSDAVIESSAFPAPERLPRYGHLHGKEVQGTFVVPMADVTASFLASSVFLPLLPMDADIVRSHSEDTINYYLCIAILCNMLSFTEGPLYNRVRGKGLAYGAYLSLSLWNGLLSYDVNDSTAPVEAFAAFHELIGEVIAECNLIESGSMNTKILCDATLQAAKATFAYSNAADRSTPSNIFSLSLRSAIRGGYPIIDPVQHARMMQQLQDLTLPTMASTIRSVMSMFLDQKNIFTVCVVPPSMKESVQSGLAAMGLSPLLRPL